MPQLITQVGEAIAAAQNMGFKVLTFVIPVDPETLSMCKYTAEEIEDGVQKVIEEKMEEMLMTRVLHNHPLTAPCTAGCPEWDGD